MAPAPALALFDFDGTLTHNDTFLGFIRHAFGYGHTARWALARVPRLCVQPSAWRKPVEQAKLDWIRYALGGKSSAWMRAQGQAFATTVLPRCMRASSVQRLLWHKQQGHHIWVVSASLRAWIEPWCRTVDVPLLCTELHEDNGMLSGELRGLHCNGPEKARRVAEVCDVRAYPRIYAYGDSAGDREMLALATEVCMHPTRL